MPDMSTAESSRPSKSDAASMPSALPSMFCMKESVSKATCALFEVVSLNSRSTSSTRSRDSARTTAILADKRWTSNGVSWRSTSAAASAPTASSTTADFDGPSRSAMLLIEPWAPLTPSFIASASDSTFGACGAPSSSPDMVAPQV